MTNVEIPKEKKTLRDDETHDIDDETHDDDRSVQRHYHHDLERIKPTCDAYDVDRRCEKKTEKD